MDVDEGKCITLWRSILVKIIPTAKESLIYFSMSTLLGQEKLNIFLVGSGAPRRRSIVNRMNSVLGMRVVCLY